MSASRAALALRVLAIAALYFAAGRIGLSLAVVNASASPVWPPTGLALGALLLLGTGAWPAIALGAFLVNLTTAGSLPVAVAIAGGNTLEALAGAWLVRRYAGGTAVFNRVDTTFRFAALAAMLAPVVSATIGVTALSLAGLAAPVDVAAVWTTWWLGDLCGAVIVTPLVVLWFQPDRFNSVRARPLEAAALLVTQVAVALLVFWNFTALGRERHPAAFLTIPPLLWAAFRFGPRAAATCSAVLSAVAVVGTINGFGPFGAMDPNQGLLTVQSFVAIMTITALSAAGESQQRRARETDLGQLNADLEARVATRTAELRRVQERLNEAQQVAHVGSWEWEVAPDRIWWSDELYRIYGVDPGSFEASFAGFLQLVHPDDVSVVTHNVQRALESRSPFAFEHRVVRPDGQTRLLAARGDVVVDAHGRPARMRGTGQDVTELREAEEQRTALEREQLARREAEDANRLKDEFLAMLSHELRTPLNAVMGWSHMLLQGAVGEERRATALELIYRNASIQAQMISDLLDISRVTSRTLTINRGLIDLPAVIEAAVETVRPTAVAKGIALVMDLDEAAWVDGDAKRLGQVVNNLLGNAVKFTPGGGTVTIRLARADGMAELTVQDTGPGISEAFLPHVFDRFRQADASVTREHGGLGLGLAIARHIVELHGGTIAVRNRTDASGTVFTVALPRPA